MKYRVNLPKREEFVLGLQHLVKDSMFTFSPEANKAPFAGLKEALVIGMGFASNDPSDPNRSPGKSNDEIADIIAELSELAGSETKLHVLAQREVAEALRVRHPHIPVEHVLKEVGSESHISSNDILGQAWDHASRIQVKDAIVVAHRMHVLRAAWNAELWGFDVRFPHRFAFSFTWKDRPSQTQWHTWNPVVFFFWDLLSRAKLIFFNRKGVPRNRI